VKKVKHGLSIEGLLFYHFFVIVGILVAWHPDHHVETQTNKGIQCENLDDTQNGQLLQGRSFQSQGTIFIHFDNR
jgi:hypothetical protein